MKRRLEICAGANRLAQYDVYDEPTMSLDPIVAIQVMDLIIRARDINHISSLYVTKKIHEIPHLARTIATHTDTGEIVVAEAPPDRLPATRVIVLEQGRIAFSGNVEEFQKSDLPAIKELMTLDRHDHSKDPYFVDPWDKRRHPDEKLL